MSELPNTPEEPPPSSARSTTRFGALAALAAQGSTVVTLWILISNDRARHFYSRRGWELDGATKVVEMDGVTLSEVRYRRALEPKPTPSAL